jgi:hypothetical protein
MWTRHDRAGKPGALVTRISLLKVMKAKNQLTI